MGNCEVLFIILVFQCCSNVDFPPPIPSPSLYKHLNNMIPLCCLFLNVKFQLEPTCHQRTPHHLHMIHYPLAYIEPLQLQYWSHRTYYNSLYNPLPMYKICYLPMHTIRSTKQIFQPSSHMALSKHMVKGIYILYAKTM
jgi:hypothetical protein